MNDSSPIRILIKKDGNTWTCLLNGHASEDNRKKKSKKKRSNKIDKEETKKRKRISMGEIQQSEKRRKIDNKDENSCKSATAMALELYDMNEDVENDTYERRIMLADKLLQLRMEELRLLKEMAATKPHKTKTEKIKKDEATETTTTPSKVKESVSNGTNNSHTQLEVSRTEPISPDNSETCEDSTAPPERKTKTKGGTSKVLTKQKAPTRRSQRTSNKSTGHSLKEQPVQQEKQTLDIVQQNNREESKISDRRNTKDASKTSRDTTSEKKNTMDAKLGRRSTRQKKPNSFLKHYVVTPM